MATPFKLKSGNTSAFKNLGSSPVKQDVKQKITEGFSKNIHNPGKTTIVTTTAPKGTTYVETSNKTGRVVGEGAASKPKSKVIKGPTSTLASGQKIPWDSTKRQVIPKNLNMTGTSKAGNIWQKGKDLVKKGFKGASKGNILALMLGSTTTATADQPTDKQLNQNQFKKPDFKAINKDLAKSMYKPLPKKK